MTLDEIKAAIETETPSLREAFLKFAEKSGLEITTLAYAEGWRAWEWCRRQLKARGLSDEAAKEAMWGAARKHGVARGEERVHDKAEFVAANYQAVRTCLFGDEA